MTPGIHPDLSFEAYLSETDWVSSSQLKRFLPEHFKPFNGSTSADFGSILHARFTGDDTPIRVVDALTWTGKAAKDEYAQAVTNGEYAILAKELPSIDPMEKKLRDHKEASRLLVDLPGTWETSVFAESDGVPCKCRFDRLLDRHAVDIKTTKEPPGGNNLSRAVINYGYDLSTDHYLTTAAAAGIQLDGLSLIFVQNCEPFAVTVATLDEAFMERGRLLRDLALQRWLHPTMVDAYPGQSEPLELSPPGWAKL